MTESLKFTSPAPAPVSGVLACAESSGSTENNVRLARVIDIELYGRGTEQHVKIKVGTLRALTDAVELLAKEKVKVSTVDIDGKQTMCGTLKVTKLKDDVVVSGEPVKEYVLPSARGWAMVKENAVIMNGCIPASKVTLSDEMKAAIREVIRDEIADLNKAVVDILSKMRK